MSEINIVLLSGVTNDREKFTIAFLCGLIFVGAVIFYVGSNGFDQERKVVEDTVLSVNDVNDGIRRQEPKSDNTDVSLESSNSVEGWDRESGTDVVGLELQSTRERLGYIDQKDRNVYQSYSILTLETMGEAGDLTALSVLGERYYKEGKSGLAELALEKAAMFGSTEAPLTLGSTLVTIAASESTMTGKYSKSSREKLLRGFSWLALGVLREEPFAEERITDLLRANKIPLSSEEQKLVQQRATELYEELSSKREARGLRPFGRTHVKVLDALH